MYEQPSLHLELAKLKHKDYELEAERARLAAHAERAPSEGLAAIKSAVSGLRSAFSRRRPKVAQAPRSQPAV